MEVWNLYNKDRIITNLTMIRGGKVPDNYYRLVVHVCIFDGDKMLIQQRQTFKDEWPNKWDLTCGGSVIEGETSSIGIRRELSEELGIDINFEDIRPSLTINFPNGFDDFYLINRSVNISNLKLQYEEVKSVKWASKEEIFNLIDDDLFLPYNKDFINLLFLLKDNKGILRKY